MFRRALPGLMALALFLPARSHAEAEKLSALSKITVLDKKDDVTVTVLGSRAPDFTSFTMSSPFRVVIDWAGSRIEGAQAEQKFSKGLIRSVRTKQYDSEAERISRVTIELSRETAYHVEAVGTRVTVHFEPVADPIPEPEPKPEPVAKKEEKKELVYVPEGPLTEPDLPVPENPPAAPKPAPVVVAKVEPQPPPPAAAPAPAPAPQPVVAKVEPKKEAPPPVTVAKAEPKTEPKAEPKKAEPVLAKAEPKKVEPKKVEPAPAPQPVVAKAEPKKEAPVLAAAAPTRKAEPTKREEPKTIASYTPKVQSPSPKAARITAPQRTRQIAGKAWTPPGASRTRGQNVGQETIQPDGETPVDPDEPGADAPPANSGGGGGDGEADPGPRLMKYIGFRQMADVSRVFVRLDGKAKYTQKKEGDTVVIELVNTSVPVKNNTRPLDTSYFNSPVGNVQAVPSGDSTRIEIKLKETCPFSVKRIGTTIAIDFTRK